MIYELHYDNTNTYVITGNKGSLMFDTGWAGTLQKMYRALGESGLDIRDIRYLLISHFHPDHMGIAQEIADMGVTLLVPESQRDFLHASDSIFAKDKKNSFVPIKDKEVRFLTFEESRIVLGELGIAGEMIPTPGHSDDSISLILDEGAAFVGDLYPLYERELHGEPGVQESWEKILSFQPKKIYYGHAKPAVLADDTGNEKRYIKDELYKTVKKMMRLIDRGISPEKIADRFHLEQTFVNDVCRMYLTHQNVGVQGILDRIERKGK